MNERRQSLSPYLDQRIEITGMFEKYNFVAHNMREFRTALLQDVYAHVDGKSLDIGHIWLQHADPLKPFNLTFGDRIRCYCRVTEYKKRLRVPNKDGLMTVTSVSLSWPTDVEVISRLHRTVDGRANESERPEVCSSAAAESQEEPKASRDSHGAVTLIGEVRGLAERVGGWDELQKLIGALRPGS